MIDADGLNALAGRLELLAGRAAPTVLTPHAGELGRLLELDSERGRRPPARAAPARRPTRAEAIVVLKGDDTIVAAPASGSRVNGPSSPALATAGPAMCSAGMIGGLIARGLEPFAAAARRRPRPHPRRPDRRRAGRGGRVGDRQRRDRGAAGGARPGARAPRVRAPSARDRRRRGRAQLPPARRRARRRGRALRGGQGRRLRPRRRPTARAAALAGGATWLAVATAGEAAELRAELARRAGPVRRRADAASSIMALGAGADIAVWRAGFLDLVARARGASSACRPRVHVKYDSGMGRLGERDPDAVAALVDAAAPRTSVELVGLWTHFATADEPDVGLLRRAARALPAARRPAPRRAPAA